MLFGVLFVAIFCGVGGFFAKIGHDGMHESDAVLQQGASYLGKIYDYEPDYRVTVNGQPCITLVVRYLMSGQVRRGKLPTWCDGVDKGARRCCCPRAWFGLRLAH